MLGKKAKFVIIVGLPIFIVAVMSSFYFSRIDKKFLFKKSVFAEKVESSKNNKKKLKSFFENIVDYENAFSKSCVLEKKKIFAGITSHHFLAKDFIANFYNGIDDDVENIILIGPDHYNALKFIDADAVSTEYDWETPYGDLYSNQEQIQKILDNNKNIIITDEVFSNEHSIYTEIPFIKKVFPHAKIIPIVVKNVNEYDNFIKIGENLRSITQEKTIMIISSDFSHEATVSSAKKCDNKCVNVLWNLNKEYIDDLECDCRACMAIMLGFLGNESNFYLVDNKNSADFGGLDDSVTSYINGYFLSN